MYKSNKRLFFTLAVLFTGGLSTILMLLLSTGNAFMLEGLSKPPDIIRSISSFASVYIFAVWIPSLIVFFSLLQYGKKHYPQLTKLIWIGAIGGIIATFALDTFRQLGVIHGWLPVDTIKMFGKMIAGPKSSELTWTFWGFIYHFLNGMSFGVIYVILFGVRKWYWGLGWGLVIEVAMMTLPPMVFSFGPFGVKTGSPALFIITLVAHIAFGILLGIWCEKETAHLDDHPKR